LNRLVIPLLPVLSGLRHCGLGNKLVVAARRIGQPWCRGGTAGSVDDGTVRRAAYSVQDRKIHAAFVLVMFGVNARSTQDRRFEEL